MEANKVTIFLFLLLVVILAVSGFLIYDALGSFPALSKSTSSVGMTVHFVNSADKTADVGTSINFVNTKGGAR